MPETVDTAANARFVYEGQNDAAAGTFSDRQVNINVTTLREEFSQEPEAHAHIDVNPRRGMETLREHPLLYSKEESNIGIRRKIVTNVQVLRSVTPLSPT